ncbi:MAG: hypothetical protein GX088_04075 [Clostridia bacterium]|nr:hypothetical protein [Clostridia bacterium]
MDKTQKINVRMDEKDMNDLIRYAKAMGISKSTLARMMIKERLEVIRQAEQEGNCRLELILGGVQG